MTSQTGSDVIQNIENRLRTLLGCSSTIIPSLKSIGWTVWTPTPDRQTDRHTHRQTDRHCSFIHSATLIPHRFWHTIFSEIVKLERKSKLIWSPANIEISFKVIELVFCNEFGICMEKRFLTVFTGQMNNFNWPPKFCG